jgi:RNA recognition motif-containing protein
LKFFEALKTQNGEEMDKNTFNEPSTPPTDPNEVNNNEDKKKMIDFIGPVVEVEEDDKNRIKKKDIFVGNLSLYTTNDNLTGYFSKFGQVEDVRIMYHPETRRSRR